MTMTTFATAQRHFSRHSTCLRELSSANVSVAIATRSSSNSSARVDRQSPSGLDLHLIVDNYATHKHPSVTAWIEKHPRFHLHFIPTSSSWLNLVERWFAEITRKRFRRGSFKSVADLIEATQLYIDHNNSNPKPFVWTKRVDQILEKVARCKDASVTAN